MTEKKIKIGTIGHVDHNKTTLAATIAMALSMDEPFVYRNAMDVFCDDGIGRKSQKIQPPKEKTKYDHDAVLKNEIKQAKKAAKRLSRR